MKQPISKKYAYTWMTLGLFVFSFVGHWAFAWPVYVQEQEEHGQPVEFSGYFLQTARDMFENWQSEFLQLIWQVFGLAILWHVGSPQSKEGDDRKEAKIDALVQKVLGPKGAKKLLQKVEEQYPKK